MHHHTGFASPLALHALVDPYYITALLHTELLQTTLHTKMQAFAALQCNTRKTKLSQNEKKKNACLQRFGSTPPGKYRGEQCRMMFVGGSAVCRVEGSVPALLQPPRGSHTALLSPALPPRGAPLCCRGRSGGSPRPAARWGALHHTGQVQPLV